MKNNSWRPFLLVSLALCIGTLGTALASPLYPIYQELWHLLPSHITYIFVAYMFGCLATLLFLGRTSNSIGYLRSLQIGLVFVILGLILSAWASTAYTLAIGRFIIGIASGLISTSAMLGLIYTIPEQHKSNAAQFSSIITVLGFGLGPLVGGLIAEFSAQPLITPYLPIIVIAVLSLFSLFSLKTPRFETQPFSAAPHLELPEKSYHAAFFIAGLTAFTAFGTFSLFASLAASFVQEIIPWHGPLVSGSAISSILFISAAVQFYAKSMSPNRSIQIGLGALLVSFVLLGLCMTLHWSWLFFVSDILVGIGHGLGLLGAFGLIHQMTHTQNRAAVMSTYLFVGYLGTIVPIIAVGYLADHFGLMTGVLGFCLAIGLLCLLLLMWQKKSLKI